MKTILFKLFLSVISFTCIYGMCSKKDAGLSNETWPKTGLIMTEYDADNYYMGVLSGFAGKEKGDTDADTNPEYKWTLKQHSKGGVTITNGNGTSVYIDDIFNIATSYREYVLKSGTLNPDNDDFRFKVHKTDGGSGQGFTFYLESTSHPEYFLASDGHDGGWTGYSFHNQTEGSHKFWLK